MAGEEREHRGHEPAAQLVEVLQERHPPAALLVDVVIVGGSGGQRAGSGELAGRP